MVRAALEASLSPGFCTSCGEPSLVSTCPCFIGLVLSRHSRGIRRLLRVRFQAAGALYLDRPGVLQTAVLFSCSIILLVSCSCFAGRLPRTLLHSLDQETNGGGRDGRPAVRESDVKLD